MTEIDDPLHPERMKLFDEVRDGKMEPAEAEQRAAALGIGPLRPQPPLDEFDPTKESRWTLPMVLAWIVWRTTDRVREQWDDYRKEVPFWMGHWTDRKDPKTGDRVVGYRLEPQTPASSLDLMLDESFGDATRSSAHGRHGSPLGEPLSSSTAPPCSGRRRAPRAATDARPCARRRLGSSH